METRYGTEELRITAQIRFPYYLKKAEKKVERVGETIREETGEAPGGSDPGPTCAKEAGSPN
ncbi:hypothetical protein E2C01_086183 [Portunus trituberculatus]|uniref:Uncharacterized protein n=1 Tax=Portunus trituberculatus TaxID=210409 RepID=A0A5B7JFN5_PORTR|nr:hypothetical protein [Portunus trituberculatus]